MVVLRDRVAGLRGFLEGVGTEPQDRLRAAPCHRGPRMRRRALRALRRDRPRALAPQCCDQAILELDTGGEGFAQYG